jgi:hypothetical protein
MQGLAFLQLFTIADGDTNPKKTGRKEKKKKRG